MTCSVATVVVCILCVCLPPVVYLLSHFGLKHITVFQWQRVKNTWIKQVGTKNKKLHLLTRDLLTD